MGVIVKITCKHCGFASSDVFLGPGFACSHEPVVCRDCGCLSSAPIDELSGRIKAEYAHCRNCSSENIAIWDGACPQCGAQDMDEEPIGMWD